MVESEEDWKNLLDKVWNDLNKLADMIEQLPDSKLEEIFIDKKYGTCCRNLNGISEHSHYHLGQVVPIRKIIKNYSN